MKSAHLPSMAPAKMRAAKKEESARLIWQRRPSMLARLGFLCYFALIVDASLYPFTGWSDNGIGAFDYLFAPWPPHALEFDIVVNLLGYLPLGLLGVAALYPTIRSGLAAVLVALGAGLASLLLEAAQSFIPTRVASKVDLITNFAGALAGVAIGLVVTEALLDRGRLRAWRLIWFEREASAALVVSLLWFGAVLYPESYAIGCGALIAPLAKQWSSIAALQTSLAEAWGSSAQMFERVDAIVSGCYLAAALLLFVDAARSAAPRLWLMAAFVVLTLFAKTMGAGLTYAPSEPFIWITPGAIYGFSGAVVLAALALPLRPGLKRALAALLLVIALALANFGPTNVYFDAVSRSWERGRLLNFYGIALGLSLAWPFIALGLALSRRSRQRQAARRRTRMQE